MKYRALNKCKYSAIALALSVGLMNNANADVYAVAINELTNLEVIFSTPTLPATALFSVDASATLDSTLPGTVNSVDYDGTNGVAPYNVTQAFESAGAATAENTFTAVGDLGYNYARADAAILSSELIPGAPPIPTGDTTHSVNIAESYLNVDDKGFGDAGNSSVTSVDFTALGGETVTFNFDATPYLESYVDPLDSVFPSRASAEINVVFTITDDQGGIVFSWSPDGLGGGVVGGVVNVDAFDLNIATVKTETNTGTVTFDPGTGTFSATSFALAAGVYSLELRMRETVNTRLTKEVQVPEPATLGLMGLGFLGMGFARNRRKRLAAS